MDWREEQLIGFDVKSMSELKRAIALGVNMVELKPGFFEKNGCPLYFYQGGRFISNRGILQEVAEMVGGKVVAQIHIPFESGVDIKRESGLSMGVKEHHDVLLQRFEMFEYILRVYGLGTVLTIHPPLFKNRHGTFLNEEEAMENTRIFFERLDAIRYKHRYMSEVGVENVPMVKELFGLIGYKVEHFVKMLGKTRTIGLTVDTGHLRLSPEMDFDDFVGAGFSVVNIHFQGNEGKIDPVGFDDDEHLAPHGKTETEDENVIGYKNCIRYFKRHKTPIVLEISTREHDDQYLTDLLNRIRTETA